jgi:hypothetical protein
METLKFEEVKKCSSAQEFNSFTRQYLDERNLKPDDRKKLYWALFYTWKGNIKPNATSSPYRYPKTD